MPDTVDVQSTIPQRAYDGLAAAALQNSLTVQALSSDILANAGFNYASLFQVGVLTSAGFVARFTPTEYGGIIESAATDEDVAGLVAQLTSSPWVALDDPRLVPGLQLLVDRELLAADRPAEILSFDRPEPTP